MINNIIPILIKILVVLIKFFFNVLVKGLFPRKFSPFE